MIGRPETGGSELACAGGTETLGYCCQRSRGIGIRGNEEDAVSVLFHVGSFVGIGGSLPYPDMGIPAFLLFSSFAIGYYLTRDGVKQLDINKQA